MVTVCWRRGGERQCHVGVGMPVTQHALHRSVRAALPHTAPASGHDDRTSMKQPFGSASGRLTHEPGSMPGARYKQTDFPWPAAFPATPARPGRFRPGVVRQLPRYYAAVRLLSAMAHRRTPEGFPMRCAPEDAEDPETSRFPREMCPRMLGVCDCAGSALALPKRQARRGLRLVSTASAPRTTRTSRLGAWMTRLNARPAFSPVSASPTLSRVCTHDSGPP
jgi:hypothetical protein